MPSLLKRRRVSLAGLLPSLPAAGGAAVSLRHTAHTPATNSRETRAPARHECRGLAAASMGPATDKPRPPPSTAARTM